MDAILTLLGVSLLGLLRLLRGKTSTNRRREFAVEYHNRLAAYVSGGGSDDDAYIWLTRHAIRIQGEAGALGVAAAFTLPGAGPTLHNYQVFVNGIPEIRTWASHGLFPSAVGSYANLVRDCLLRHIGVLDQLLTRYDDALRNPIVWFREGVAALLAAPVRILHGLGLFGLPTARSIEASRVFRLAAAAVSVIGFASALVGLLTGWDAFIAIMRRLLRL